MTASSVFVQTSARKLKAAAEPRQQALRRWRMRGEGASGRCISYQERKATGKKTKKKNIYGRSGVLLADNHTHLGALASSLRSSPALRRAVSDAGVAAASRFSRANISRQYKSFLRKSREKSRNAALYRTACMSTKILGRRSVRAEDERLGRARAARGMKDLAPVEITLVGGLESSGVEPERV